MRIRLADADQLEESGVTGNIRLWVERVPALPDGAAAVRRRHGEMARAVGPGQDVRAVLLRYLGGAADLILVARRAALPQMTLYRLAAALLGCQPGDDEAHRSPLSGIADGDPATWLTALSVVLAGYAGPGAAAEPPTAAALLARPEAGAGKDPAETTVLVSVPDDAKTTLGDLTGRIRAQLRAVLASPGHAPPADGSRPAAGLVFTLQAGGRLAEAAAEIEYVPCLSPVFPLTISVAGDPGGDVRLCCYYRPECFAPALAEQFPRHLAEVHRQVVGAPGLPLAAVSLLDRRERDRVIALGHAWGAPRTRPACVHDLFANVVSRQPDAVALSDGKRRVSYLQLDTWSNRLAQGLRRAGVRDRDRLGVCLDRSAELVAAVLAILKAGATYVPMDPGHPAERLAYTVSDAALTHVIAMPGGFPALAGVRVITPAELAGLGAEDAAVGPASTVTAADPAYVIYTSGSTGRPKGVVVPHANVASLIDATCGGFRLAPADVWTAFHSPAFDFSVWEIWGCLLTGGHLIVVPRWITQSPAEFGDLVVETRVTVLSQTPSAFAQLLQADRRDPRDLAVRLAVFGGETLDARMLLPWFDRHPESRCRVVNMFGITETTVHVTAQTITRRHALAASRSVGRALPGWHLYVMDAAQRLVPPGVVGEIYVGGAGVALGYLNRAGLTSERFLPDPFAGGRMYRSGDLGRLCPDGTLDHLGRIDSQVKVRGYRIELDEIRSVLLEQRGVTAAAVVLSSPVPADAAAVRIAAYVVLTEGNAAEVRRRAARLLPDYMVPATVTALPTLPLTANGKLDTANLPAPQVPAHTPVTGEPPPDHGGLTDELLATWRQVLGVTAGPDDDFFELGGNSLLAIRIAARMRERGWPPLPVRDIYLNPSVRLLAKHFSQLK